MTRELTYREIIREFLFFLKKENAYKEYIKAIKQQKRYEIRNWGNHINILTINSLKDCFRINSNEIGHLIDFSFQWAKTKEGQSFWSALDIKWYDKMRDTKLVAEKLTHK